VYPKVFGPNHNKINNNNNSSSSSNNKNSNARSEATQRVMAAKLLD
jgi:hypothetical protein